MRPANQLIDDVAVAVPRAKLSAISRVNRKAGVEEVDLPVLLDLPAPRLRAYARETIVAEKFQVMVALGKANSRMKDFYDVWVLSKTYDFNLERRLAQAIAATFARGQTAIPEALPDGLYA